MDLSTDLFALLSSLVLLVYAHAPWLVWGVVIVVGTFLWFYAWALIHAAWRLCTSQDEREWFRFLHQAKRDHRRQEWARAKAAWRTDLWHRGDGPVLVGLVLLAAIVIALCR